MTKSLNKVTLIGNLGRDPEVRTFQNGSKVCNFSIATSERWRDRETQEDRERTEWHSIAIYAEPLIRISEQYLHKGSKVFVEGQLETRKWQDQNGNDKYRTDIVLRPYKGELIMLDSRAQSEHYQQHAGSAPYQQDHGQQQYGGGGMGHGSGMNQGGMGQGAGMGQGNMDAGMDDDIPF